MSMIEIKAAARRDAVERRKLAHAVVASHAAEDLAAHVFPAVAKVEAATVSGYFPYQTEIDVTALLGRLAGEGWVSCMPVVIGAGLPLVFRRWYPGEPTVAGKWNIPVPVENSETVEPDVLLVPMLAFDRKGYRLGYGGGFYDRTLEALRRVKPVTALGVAYSAQEVAQVPREDFDQPLDYILTEKEVFKCG